MPVTSRVDSDPDDIYNGYLDRVDRIPLSLNTIILRRVDFKLQQASICTINITNNVTLNFMLYAVYTQTE